MNEKFVGLDEKVSNRIEAARKPIKNGINYESKINYDRKLECRTKNVNDLNTKNVKMDGVIHLVSR